MINPFLKNLYDEHSIIVNAIDVAHQSERLIGKDNEQYELIIGKLINFFRNYADKYHHYKEEQVLFPEMNKRNELLQDGVVGEMFDNHENFREMIGSIEKNLNAKNYSQTQNELRKYGKVLLDHITVENDELFQMAESIFDQEELEKINHRFIDCDRDLGDQQKEELQELVNSLRQQLFLMD